MERSTWVEVSRAGLRRNFEAVASHAGAGVCAVVKANAYGHGLAEAARTFVEAGAVMVGVSRLEEARAIRDAGIDASILIMMPTPDPAAAVELDCDLTLSAPDDLARLPAGARAHLKVDIGMGRLGIDPHQAVPVANVVREHCSLEAVWTHFPDAAGPLAAEQLARFRVVVDDLRAEGMTIAAHASNSAALLALPEARFDMVRVGTLLYGQDPPGASAPWEHAPTFAWYARAVAVRDVPAGTSVGYGSEWRAPAPRRIATLPVGYADGFGVEPHARTPSAREAMRAIKGALRPLRSVRFEGGEAPVVGRVAMNAITVDVSDVAGVEPGSVARIPARRLMVSPAIERVWT